MEPSRIPRLATTSQNLRSQQRKMTGIMSLWRVCCVLCVTVLVIAQATAVGDVSAVVAFAYVTLLFSSLKFVHRSVQLCRPSQASVCHGIDTTTSISSPLCCLPVTPPGTARATLLRANRALRECPTALHKTLTAVPRTISQFSQQSLKHLLA